MEAKRILGRQSWRELANIARSRCLAQEGKRGRRRAKRDKRRGKYTRSLIKQVSIRTLLSKKRWDTSLRSCQTLRTKGVLDKKGLRRGKGKELKSKGKTKSEIRRQGLREHRGLGTCYKMSMEPSRMEHKAVGSNTYDVNWVCCPGKLYSNVLSACAAKVKQTPPRRPSQ